MIPFGHETVTLVRRRETKDQSNRTRVTYDTVLLTGCSWRRTTRIIRNDNAMITEESTVCRIPIDQTKPMTGDLLILGEADVTVTSGAAYQGLIEQYRDSDGAFVVASVKDNAREGMPLGHWAARG